MKKIFGRVLSMLTTITMACSVLLTVPVSVQAENFMPVKVEAESCTLGNGATVATTVYGTKYPGYSGDGFVWASNAGTITLKVTIPKNGMYELSTRCWMYLGKEGETRLQAISINGVPSGNFYIPNKGGWIDFSFGFFYLEAGTTTIEIGSSGSWGFILYDTVTFDYAHMPDLKIDAAPCDVKATSETKSLKKYLTSVYGNHIISGQQEIYGGGNDGNSELEFDYIYDKTGKYPAIRGFDLMNYNPLYGWEDGTTDRIINWVNKRGGIATSSWHINIPSDFTSYKLGEKLDWTKCTYKPTTSFKAANCLDKTTKEYAYLMLAIDDLAKQLLILQDAKVPLLLRPFHEAEGYNNTDGSGAWFWWGSSGSEVYKQLWKLLYTTLTEKYGIHNIIWEVNLYTYANSPEWYPGDNYVDIVGYDKYEGSPTTWKTSAASTVFLSLVNDTKDTKMVAMTENDTIPDIKNMVNEGAWWLYFCPWYGEFIMSSKNNDPTLLKTIYNSDYVITLDELPNIFGGTQQTTKGDVNGDGVVNLVDATMLKSVILKKKDVSIFKSADSADMNSDSVINAIDYLLLKKKIQEVI